MSKNLYTYEMVRQILQTEEKNGRLTMGVYIDATGIVNLSRQMKDKRREIRNATCEEREELQLELKLLQERYVKKTQEEQEDIAQEIVSRHFTPWIKVNHKMRDTYVVADTYSMVVSKIIAKELKQGYAIRPQNRDTVIEQLSGLLQGDMPKVVIRADVCDFFESIPQEPLFQQIISENKVSSYTIKYLRNIFYQYNTYRSIDDSEIGVPRGLAFSSYLSELYMMRIDAMIKAIPGVYYYKRYVDDMIIVANPALHTPEEYWQQVEKCFDNTGLQLHHESDGKRFIALWDNTKNDEFTYLGYTFRYQKGKLDLRLSAKRYDKYRKLLDAIFDIYDQCSHYRTRKTDRIDRRVDALHQLMSRLRVLTGNGLLHGRKCHVANGVYYSNKYLTDLSQLAELDAHLCELVEYKFNPPTNIFNYSETNGYEQNVSRIKNKLKSFSFVQSFQRPQLIPGLKYEIELTKLKYIYLSLPE